jgi:flagellar basal body-associated protein FliL
MGKNKLQNAVTKGPLLFIILAIAAVVFLGLLYMSFWWGGQRATQQTISTPKPERPLTEAEKSAAVAETLHTTGTTESLNTKEEQQVYRTLDNRSEERGVMTRADRQRLLDALNGI